MIALRQIVSPAGETGPQPILGDEPDAGADERPAGATGQIITFYLDPPGNRRAQPGERLGELALPVPRHPGDTDDLPLARV